MINFTKNLKKKFLNVIVIIFILIISIFFYIIQMGLLKNNAIDHVNDTLKDQTNYLEKNNKRQYQGVRNGESRLDYIDLSLNEYNLLVDKTSLPYTQINSLSNILSGYEDELFKYIYYHDDKLYYQDLYEHEVSISKDSHEYYIIDKNGIIVEKFNLGITNNFDETISIIMDVNFTTDNFKYYDDVLLTMVKGQYVSIAELENLSYYLIQIAPVSIYYDSTQLLPIKIVMILIVLFLISYIVFLAIRKNEFRNEESGNELLSKYQYFYTAFIDNKGNFLEYNDLFEKLFVQNNETNLRDLNYSFSKEDDSKSFTIRANGQDYLFNHVYRSDGIMIVGENYTEMLLKQKDEMYTNEISQIANNKAFEDYLKTLTTDDSITFISIDIKDYSQIVIINGQETADLIIRYIPVFLKRIIQSEQTKIFHRSADVFVIAYQTNEITHVDTKWIKSKIMELNKELLNLFKIKVEFKVGLLCTNKELLTHPIEIYYKLRELQKQTNQLYPNTVLVYNEYIQNEVLGYNKMKKDIEQGIKKDEFIIFLQPKLNVKTFKVTAFEALLRWNNEKYNKLSPEKYIKAAEENDLIHLLGNIIIKKSLQALSELNDPEAVISINISPKQFLERGFVNNLIEQVELADIHPSQVALEVTETMFIKSISRVNSVVSLLKKIGFKLYLDDFGTGYSSLQYLNELPVDVIKIDRSFINGLSTSTKVVAITNTIVEMAQKLGLGVIAEGVETVEQLRIVEEMGVDYIQGYIISKPLPVKEALLLYNKKYEF